MGLYAAEADPERPERELESHPRSREMFWLYEWLNRYGVADVEHAMRLLGRTAPHRALRELAEAEYDRARVLPYEPEPLPAGQTLVAGRGIDLSGDLDCLHWECRKVQLDLLFSRIWHYFDHVVVVGTDAGLASKTLAYGPEHVSDRMEQDIRLLLYLRQIGADKIVIFRQKPPPCELHFEEHVREAGLERVLDLVSPLAEYVARDSTFELEPHDDHHHYTLEHPAFDNYAHGTLWEPLASTERGRHEQVARAAVKRYVAHLTADARAARALDAPLGSTVRLHGKMLGLTASEPSVSDVAFHLELPVLNGMDIPTLLDLRESERCHFDAFRHSLRTAARERLQHGEASDPKQLAREIQEDVIAPALTDLERQLDSAARAYSRKRRSAVTVGSLLTACGVFAAQPLLAAAGLATSAAVVGAKAKLIDDEREASLSGMYFLWRALSHAERS